METCVKTELAAGKPGQNNRWSHIDERSFHQTPRDNGMPNNGRSADAQSSPGRSVAVRRDKAIVAGSQLRLLRRRTRPRLQPERVPDNRAFMAPGISGYRFLIGPLD